MRWITRERPKIDRVACPWLISRFIDPEAEFIFVPPTEVIEKPKNLNGQLSTFMAANSYNCKFISTGEDGRTRAMNYGPELLLVGAVATRQNLVYSRFAWR